MRSQVSEMSKCEWKYLLTAKWVQGKRNTKTLCASSCKSFDSCRLLPSLLLLTCKHQKPEKLSSGLTVKLSRWLQLKNPPWNIYWCCTMGWLQSELFVLMFLCLRSWGQGVISVTCVFCAFAAFASCSILETKSLEHAYISVKYVWAPLCARGQMCVLCTPYAHSGSSLTAFRLWEQWRGWKARADSSHLGPQ